MRISKKRKNSEKDGMNGFSKDGVDRVLGAAGLVKLQTIDQDRQGTLAHLCAYL